MKKRLRLWVCKICGKHYTRFKKDKDRYCCKELMIRARKYHNSLLNKRDRIKKKISNFQEKYYSKLRNVGGKILKINPKTKQLWKGVKKCKLKPTLIKRGQLFLDSLKEDIWNCPEDKMAKQIDEQGNISKSRGGFSGAPKLMLVDTYKEEHGRFRSGFKIGGAFIELNIKHNIKDMKETLLHETLHWIDNLSNTPSNHDCYFKRRLEILSDKFKLN